LVTEGRRRQMQNWRSYRENIAGFPSSRLPSILGQRCSSLASARLQKCHSPRGTAAKCLVAFRTQNDWPAIHLRITAAVIYLQRLFAASAQIVAERPSRHLLNCGLPLYSFRPPENLPAQKSSVAFVRKGLLQGEDFSCVDMCC